MLKKLALAVVVSSLSTASIGAYATQDETSPFPTGETIERMIDVASADETSPFPTGGTIERMIDVASADETSPFPTGGTIERTIDVT